MGQGTKSHLVKCVREKNWIWNTNSNSEREREKGVEKKNGIKGERGEYNRIGIEEWRRTRDQRTGNLIPLFS